MVFWRQWRFRLTQTYTKKAKFSEVVIAAEARKASVETCFREYGGHSTTVTGCTDATNGIPAAHSYQMAQLLKRLQLMFQMELLLQPLLVT